MKQLTGLLFCLAIAGTVAHELENSIIGDPLVQCGTDSILVGLRTAHAFAGRLYVEGESEQPGCSQSHAKTPSPGVSTEFRIKFGNMRRQRTLNPRGVAYSFTLIASFHPLFVTGLDRAFHIRCFFTEAVKAVESAIDVNRLTTQIIQKDFSLPQCTYQLREGFNGPTIRFANVGDPVTHVWECDSLAGLVYGILIHSCYVDDGHGNRFALTDERGCAVDRFLLRDLSYDAQAISAHVNSYVFKYADRVQLFFTCTVQLCFKDDGGCDGITPPKCGSPEGPSISPNLRIPPLGLHRRPLPPFVNHPQMPQGFPRPKNIEYPAPDQTSSKTSIKNRDFFGPIRGRSRGGLQERNEPRNRSPFGAAGYELSPFGSPFKDSPLNNETDVSLIEDIRNATTEAKRTSREARQMESDLSVELTVIPIENEIPRFVGERFDALRPKTHCFTLSTIFLLAATSIAGIFLSSILTALILTKKFLKRPKITHLRYNY